MRRLLLDTTLLIDYERSESALDSLIDDDDDLALAAVTVAELGVGVNLADDDHRHLRRSYVEALLSVIEVIDYDRAVAEHHADLLAFVRRSGRPRGAHDLIIAATARASGRTVVTADLEGFADLPGVRSVSYRYRS